jgi:transposase InsO family protein
MPSRSWEHHNPSDPHRRVRRHRYQEGPGFLFLATQDGRPPHREGGRPDLSKVRARMRAVRLAQEKGVEAACSELGRSPASLYRWLAAFERSGIEGLLERSRRPRQVRTQIPAWVDTVILTVRLLTYWNSKRISAELARRGVYEVSATYIDRLFRRSGCSRGSVIGERGPRYERSRPNELWHIDVKGPYFINLGRRGEYVKTWMVGLVDDYSRFLIGLRIHTDMQAAPILEWLDDCFELCGQPLELMSDNGRPFVVWMPGVLTRFGKRMEELRIRHLRTQVNSPWTNGKIEAFWNLLQAEVLDRYRYRSLAEAESSLLAFARYYNYHRLSGTLGWLTPAERYDGTPFTDRGFENIPLLEHLQPWLTKLMGAA